MPGRKSLLLYHLPLLRVVLDNYHSDNNTNNTQYDCSRNSPRTIYVYQMTEK